MKRLVLAGAGHAHAEVLLDWCRAPLAGVELVVVSPQRLAPYSGMTPGWLAGVYRFDEIVIDFVPLCAAAGARWVEAELDALDPARRRLRLSDGQWLDYDVLSLNVGSTLRPPPDSAATVLSLRPLSGLQARYETFLASWSRDESTLPFTVVAVGGGAAGFESVLAVRQRLRRLRPDRTVHAALVHNGTALLPELSAPARRAAERALALADVTVQLGGGWCDAIGRSCDLVLWATGAEAHDWQRDPVRRGALAVNEQGFVRIDATLRSVSHPEVFAAGDCAHWDAGPHRLPKSGVVAVRMAPVLSRNLRAALDGSGNEAQRYRPQRRFLVLLGTGDGRAIASRGAFGASGAWVWAWKEWIDRRFLRRFAGLLPAPGLQQTAAGAPNRLADPVRSKE